MALFTVQNLRFRVRAGLAAAVAALNEIPLVRELVFETDTGRAKLGDGVSNYNDMTYVGWGRADLTTLNDGQVMQYDATLEHFVPVDMVGGSGSSLDPPVALYLYEEFMRGAVSSANSGTNYIFTSALPVSYAGGSSGGSLGLQTGFTADHPGVVDLSTGTGTTALHRLYPWSGPNLILGAGAVRIRWCFMIGGPASDGTNRYSVDIGLRDGITGSGTNGLLLTYSDNINSGQWRIQTLVAGTPTVVDSAVAVAIGSWLTVELNVNAAGNSATYSVNGTTIGTITSGIPTVAQGVNIGIGKSLGTSARHLYVDFVDMSYTFTTPRQ